MTDREIFTKGEQTLVLYYNNLGLVVVYSFIWKGDKYQQGAYKFRDIDRGADIMSPELNGILIAVDSQNKVLSSESFVINDSADGRANAIVGLMGTLQCMEIDLNNSKEELETLRQLRYE